MTRMIDVSSIARMLVATCGTSDPCDPRPSARSKINRFTYGLTDYEREQVARQARVLMTERPAR